MNRPPAPDNQGASLQMIEVTAGYFEKDTVLDSVSIDVRPGAVTAILGPNGSGKSTALRVMSGFLPARQGKILLDGEEISARSPGERLAQGISFLPQGRSIFPELTVEDNLVLGAWLLRHNKSELKSAVEAMFDRYPLLKGFRHRMAGSLSGGQARMLEFARTLIVSPSVLLIDEPSVGLAPFLVDEVYDELERLKGENNTILLVDQNVSAAVKLADYVYTLAYGENHLQGSKDSFEGQLDGLIQQWLSL